MIYNFRGDKIALISDTHSQDLLYEILSTRVPNGYDVVALGDHGIGFGFKELAIENTFSWLKHLNKRCKEMDVILYIIRGNHDATYREIWYSQWSNIILTKSGDLGIFPNGKKTLLVGGGISVDRYVRKENIDYWKDEITPFPENVPSCDILFSHDTAEWFNHPTSTLGRHFAWYVERDPTLIGEAQKQRELLGDIIKCSGVKVHFSGHYHNAIREEKFGCYYRCLDINEVFEFDSDIEYTL